MPRTIESIVECHQVARARRRAGRPIWDLKIPVRSVLHDYERAGDDLRPEQAAELSQRLYKLLMTTIPQEWLAHDHPNYSQDLEDVLDALKDATAASFENSDFGSPCDQVDDMLEQIYDWGDKMRVWLG